MENPNKDLMTFFRNAKKYYEEYDGDIHVEFSDEEAIITAVLHVDKKGIVSQKPCDDDDGIYEYEWTDFSIYEVQIQYSSFTAVLFLTVEEQYILENIIDINEFPECK